jgi:hypothetical protein
MTSVVALTGAADGGSDPDLPVLTNRVRLAPLDAVAEETELLYRRLATIRGGVG